MWSLFLIVLVQNIANVKCYHEDYNKIYNDDSPIVKFMSQILTSSNYSYNCDHTCIKQGCVYGDYQSKRCGYDICSNDCICIACPEVKYFNPPDFMCDLKQCQIDCENIGCNTGMCARVYGKTDVLCSCSGCPHKSRSTIRTTHLEFRGIIDPINSNIIAHFTEAVIWSILGISLMLIINK